MDGKKTLAGGTSPSVETPVESAAFFKWALARNGMFLLQPHVGQPIYNNVVESGI